MYKDSNLPYNITFLSIVLLKPVFLPGLLLWQDIGLAECHFKSTCRPKNVTAPKQFMFLFA